VADVLSEHLGTPRAARRHPAGSVEGRRGRERAAPDYGRAARLPVHTDRNRGGRVPFHRCAGCPRPARDVLPGLGRSRGGRTSRLRRSAAPDVSGQHG
jgi:hypothetical protein